MRVKNSAFAKKLTASITMLIMLCTLLAATVYGLTRVQKTIGNDTFSTGYVKVSMTGEDGIFTKDDDLMEPGRRIIKTFTVTNVSSEPVTYKISLKNVEGKLKNHIVFDFLKGDKKVDSIAATSEKMIEPDWILSPHAKDSYSVVAYLDDDELNEELGSVDFDIEVDATQAKNRV